MITKNFGILASIDWNSNKWAGLPSEEDLNHSNFGFVMENGISYTAINFGHEIFPCDDEGYYHGLLPQLWTRMPDNEKSKHVEIVFMKAQDWKNKQNYIVGFYAFPWIEKSMQPFALKALAENFTSNIMAFPKDIHLLENPVVLSGNKDLNKFLPKEKSLGKRGYNYLTKENVYKLLDEMTALNPNDKKLSSIKFRLITTIDKVKF